MNEETKTTNGHTNRASSTIRETLQHAFERSDVRRIYGEPLERNGRTIVPVADVGASFGFGLGSGGQSGEAGEGGGGGGKTGGTPIGYLEVDENGTKFRPVYDANRLGVWIIAAATFLLWMLIRKR